MNPFCLSQGGRIRCRLFQCASWTPSWSWLLVWAIQFLLPGDACGKQPDPGVATPRFQSLSIADTGIGFTNTLPLARHLTNQLMLDGSGVALGDVDGDGRCDVFLAGLGGRSTLWRNLGDWRFVDLTSKAGLDLGRLDVTGCVLVDLTGNGLPDLVINTHGQGTHFFRNVGQGQFERWAVFNEGKGGHSLAVADVDGDGWLDVYVVNYRARALMDMPNARADLKVVGGRTVVTAVDGRPTTAPDLTNRFVVTVRGTVEEVGESDLLLWNDGGQGFRPVSWTEGCFLDEEGVVLTSPPWDWGLSALFRDLTGNGRPDLLVANDFQSPDRVWFNESEPGRIRFRAAPRAWMRRTSYFSMGIDVGDLNRDGWDDAMVVDMLSPDHRLRMIQLDDLRVNAEAGRNALDRPQYGVNTLFAGGPDGWTREVAAFAGVQASDWSWSVLFLDADLDGWEDIIVGNGQHRAARDADVAEAIALERRRRRMSDAELFALRLQYPRQATANAVWRNARDFQFVPMGDEWGLDAPGVTHGMGLADLDGDGDLDLVMNMFDEAVRVYRNDSQEPRLLVRLQGSGGNTHGIGARIRVLGGPVTQTQEMMSGGRYLSGDEPVRMFALGQSDAVRVEVDWPSGLRSVVPAARAGRITIRESEASERIGSDARGMRGPSELSGGWFAEIRDPPTGWKGGPLPPWEEATDRQPLILRHVTRYGGGLGWIRSGESGGPGDGLGSLTLVSPGEAGGFWNAWDLESGEPTLIQERPVPVLQRAVVLHPEGMWVGGDDDEQGLSLTLWRKAKGSRDGSAQALWQPTPAARLPGFEWLQEKHPPRGSTITALSVADFDRDGRLDLFVGRGSRAGAWPTPVRSVLMRWSADGWQRVQPELFGETGQVRGAAWGDLTGNGWPDLAVSMEWGSVRIYRNEHGRLEPWDPPVRFQWAGWETSERRLRENPPQGIRLGRLTGGWSGVVVKDVDGDGMPDLVLGNGGENSFFELYPRPWVLFHGPILPGGGWDVWASYASRAIPWDVDPSPADLLPMWGMSRMGAVIPTLRASFPRHRDYAQATMHGLLEGTGHGLYSLEMAEIRWMRSGVLLNRGDHLLWRSFPLEAQWAPVFGIAVADFDGDGHEDVFLAQNFFGETAGVPRQDAGHGLVLRGQSGGGWKSLGIPESGIRVWEEQRGVALADFDGDGRVDIMVRLGNGRVRGWQNRAGPAGVRVRLWDGDLNPWGLGAKIRWSGTEGEGRWQPVSAGQGYGSMDDPIRILFPPDHATHWEVEWSGGVRETFPLSHGEKAVVIRSNHAGR